MKILKLLNKISSIIIIFFFLTLSKTFSENEPVDIWNIDKKKIEENSKNKVEVSASSTNQTVNSVDVFNTQLKNNNNLIEVDSSLVSKDIKLIGLYDPGDYGLKIDMWLNSNGDQLKYLFSNLAKIDLSDDAANLMNIILLTNSYSPTKNINKKDFLKIRSDWLIKHDNLELIEEYLVKNEILNLHPELSKYLVDKYLSNSELNKACDIFRKNPEPIQNEYLSKFNIYCLINDGKKEEAQLLFDLKKELGFNEKYFENKLNYLFGFINTVDKSVSENSILEFHLAHKTDPEFSFEPNENTNPLIWRYLSASNLLYQINEIDLDQLDKIKLIEYATHNGNYDEDELFEIYKRFQFNINQLLNANEAYKSLSNIESRALIYQKILLVSDVSEKLKLLKILKNSFENDEIGLAFDNKLKEFLNTIEPVNVPDNLTSFYYTNITLKKDPENKVKFNNDVLHQSKLINYFNGDYSKSKIEKDVNNFLKKVKKNKKYFFSKKDQIFLESLKFDGIEISKKYDDLYQVDSSEIPTDIQVMINNNEKGTALLRIVEVIGQDKLDRIDDDTIYFIITTLNQLNIDLLRNKLLLKVLPLKV